MDASLGYLVGFEIDQRLRLAELIEERPFSCLFRGDLLALSRVVGECSVTLYRPAQRVDPESILEELKVALRRLRGDFVFGSQQVDRIRHGPPAGWVYVTGEPVQTTLSLEIAHARFMGFEEGERVVANVARALIPCHDENSVHGRIRPYHILKTSEGWKLAGHEMVAVEDKLDRLLRRADEPAYLPPENYRDGAYGPAVDLWAMGICLHLASCGRLPYNEEADLLEQILKNPPRVERPPGRFGSVVRALLSSEPEERWGVHRCIDHIERPRDRGFEGGTNKRSEKTLDAETLATALAARAKGSSKNARTNPLFLRPKFLFFCLLSFLVGSALGWIFTKLPPVPRHNSLPDPLYSVSFQQTQVDPDGRRVTKIPAQAVAYAETLGTDNRLEMLQVRPGGFSMGSDRNEPYAEDSERPVHRVQVSGFFISRFEITQQQWAAIASLPKIERDLPVQPAHFQGDDRPVEGVSWLEAKEFCARLSRLTGRLYRLPTEAEWEFACRGGTQTPFCFGQTILSSVANYDATKPYASEGVGQYRGQTIAVGSLGSANYFGLADTHGNVAEWCEDAYDSYSDGAKVDPTGPARGRNHVVRGGSWRSYPWQCRSASRVGLEETWRRNDIGFRVALPEVIMVDNPKN